MSLDRWDSRSLVRVLGWALRESALDGTRALLSRWHSGWNSRSPFHQLARLSWWLGFSCVVIVLGVGSDVAVRSLWAEYTHTRAYDVKDMAQSIVMLRNAADRWPFERRIREASARKLAHGALAMNTEPWRLAAIAELRRALAMSKNSADLLATLITLELAQGLDADAKEHFDVFAKVARKSQFMELAESFRKTGHGMALH